MIRIFTLLMLPALLLLCSCERNVNIELPGDTNRLVVEGRIETNTPPVVLLSTSIGFFGRVTAETYLNSFVHDAEVYVSDGSRTMQLKEYTITAGGMTGYFYSVDTADPSALTFVGEIGKRYDLKIIYDDKTYTSSTTIPRFNYGLDTIWASIPTSGDIIEEDTTYRMLKASYSDDPEPGNKVRVFNSVNGGPYLSPYFSVSNDDIINGTTVEVTIDKGIDKMDTLDYSRGRLFHLGDSVSIKWCAIDNATYEFYRTLEYSYGTIGNPFATPIVVSTNIEGGALGVWAGYAVKYHHFYIAK